MTQIVPDRTAQRRLFPLLKLDEALVHRLDSCKRVLCYYCYSSFYSPAPLWNSFTNYSLDSKAARAISIPPLYQTVLMLQSQLLLLHNRVTGPFKQLLMEFHHIFCLEKNKMGCTDATEHDIELHPKQDESFKERFRRIARWRRCANTSRRCWMEEPYIPPSHHGAMP